MLVDYRCTKHDSMIMLVHSLGQLGRIFFLRLLCAFLLRACERPCSDLGELMEALEGEFRGTYDAKERRETARDVRI